MATVSTSTNDRATGYAAGRHLWFASDGTAIALYYDGSNWQWRTASSPYTSWSGATAVTNATRELQLSAFMDLAANTVHVAYKVTSGPDICYRPLTFSAGAWTLGTESTVQAGNGGGGENIDIALDSDGRIWVYTYLYNGANNGQIYYSTNGTSWTTSVSAMAANNDTSHSQGLVRAGNYLLHIFTNSGNITWRRVATNGSVGAWSSTQNFACSMWSDHSWSAIADGNDRAVLCANPTAGTDYAIRTTTYSPGTDTWGTASDIGTGTSDRDPSVFRDASGDVWCVWSEYAAASSYALVYKKWTASAQTWGSKSTLVASGSNRRYGTCGITQDGVTLGELDTSGTGTPYTVESLTATVGTAAPAVGAVVTQRSYRPTWG